jgi:hypothetical protein
VVRVRVKRREEWKEVVKVKKGGEGSFERLGR